MIIRCTSSCLFENDGLCTLTHVTSASEPSEDNCVYYKKREETNKKNQNLHRLQ